MKRAIAILLVFTMVVLFKIGVVEATPKSIALRTADRDTVLAYIIQSMQVQGYRLMVSDPYRLVFEKRLGSFFEGVIYRDPWSFKNPIFRRTWSILPSPEGLEAVADTFLVSNPRTKWEKVYDTEEIASFTDQEKFEREKLYDLYDVKAAVEGLDRYFLMRVSGLFPELKPDFPKADILMEGNRIIAVAPDGLAGRIGIRAGDIVLEMNGIPVVGDIVEIIDARLAQGNRVMLLVQRNDAREIVTLWDIDQGQY
jgi:hypothetical protein